MASMRKLHRRVLRWRRYAIKTGWYPCWTCLVTYRPPTGWDRALVSQQREWTRRNPIPRGYGDSWWAEP